MAGFFRGRKLPCFCGDSRKFSPRKSIFKQLDTALVGVVHWVTANSRKFYPRKSIFKQFAELLFRERNPPYGMQWMKNTGNIDIYDFCDYKQELSVNIAK